MKVIRQKIKNYLKVWKTQKKGDDDDIVDTDTDRETNEEESEGKISERIKQKI